MSGHWEGQRAKAVDDLFQTGADYAAAWSARREQRKADALYNAQYAAALQAAKETGILDPAFQARVPEDDAIDLCGLKVVLLRELEKLDPNHLLVVNKECRKAVASVTRIKYNRADRPNDFFDNYAPTEDEAERIIEAYK